MSVPVRYDFPAQMPASRFQSKSIRDLQSRRQKASEQDSLDCGCSMLDHRKACRDRRTSGGKRKQSQDSLRDNPQHPFRPDEEADKIETRLVLMRSAADPHNRSISQDDLQAEDVMPCYAIFQASRSPCIGSDVATNRAILETRRIRWVKQAIISCFMLQIAGNHPRFDDRDAVGFSNLFNPVHSDQGKSYTSLLRNAPPDIAITGPSRSHRNFPFVRKTKQHGNLFG